ncbi:PRC-barrel domain-containing protein [Gulosibacter sediminis]|uniref:PRC-barrel domain-containing protein n=1 Tax=Gulosibacter sediminis TaxID=1729695 RepID=UPI0024A9649E|nr:PRC-barrel domain-containing protein [Gulosibacter sediminis]
MTNQNTFSDLANADVYDSAGHKLGGVNNVYVFDGTEEPSWVTVNTGLFGSHETFIPLANAQFNSGGLVVPYEKSFIKDAPNIGPDGELSVEQENELFHYYGIDNPNAVRGNAGVPGTDTRDGERNARDTNARQGDADARDTDVREGDADARDADVRHEGVNAHQDERDAGAAGDRAALEQEFQRGDGHHDGRGAEAGVGVAGAAAAAGAHPGTGAEPLDPNANAVPRDRRVDPNANAVPGDRRVNSNANAVPAGERLDSGQDAAAGEERLDPNAAGRHAATGAGVASDPNTAGSATAPAGGASQQNAGGNLRLRKRVVTETKLVEVPVQREEIVVENPDGSVSPVDGADGGAPVR